MSGLFASCCVCVQWRTCSITDVPPSNWCVLLNYNNQLVRSWKINIPWCPRNCWRSYIGYCSSWYPKLNFCIKSVTRRNKKTLCFRKGKEMWLKVPENYESLKIDEVPKLLPYWFNVPFLNPQISWREGLKVQFTFVDSCPSKFDVSNFKNNVVETWKPTTFLANMLFSFCPICCWSTTMYF